MECHAEKNKYCHYFNNKDFCPYEDIKCKFDKTCRYKLCQFKHSNKDEEQNEMNNGDGNELVNTDDNFEESDQDEIV